MLYPICVFSRKEDERNFYLCCGICFITLDGPAEWPCHIWLADGMKFAILGGVWGLLVYPFLLLPLPPDMTEILLNWTFSLNSINQSNL